MKGWFSVAVIALLAAIAFGANWMACEQHRANEGVFVPFPSPQRYHLEPSGGGSRA